MSIARRQRKIRTLAGTLSTTAAPRGSSRASRLEWPSRPAPLTHLPEATGLLRQVTRCGHHLLPSARVASRLAQTVILAVVQDRFLANVSAKHKRTLAKLPR